MVKLDELVQEVQQAYRQGKAGAGDGHSGYQEYQFQIQAEIQQWDSSFLPNELTIRGIFSELLRTTIKTIREEDVSRAESLIAALQGLIDSGELSRDTRCVCQSFLEAAAAYLDYRCQRYEQAIARLQEALALDEQVEQRNPDFAYLHLHRIMLLDNWIRALARRQQYRQAISLAFQSLDYLERKISSLPVPTSWDSSQLAVYPEGALSILFRTITAEIAECVTGKDEIDCAGEIIPVRDVFADRFHLALADAAGQVDNTGNCHLSQASHDWIYMKQAALDKNIPAVLQYAVRILAASPVPVSRPTLWNAAVVEFMLISRQIPECKNGILEEFRAEIVQDAISWKHFPQAWKAMITEA